MLNNNEKGVNIQIIKNSFTKATTMMFYIIGVFKVVPKKISIFTIILAIGLMLLFHPERFYKKETDNVQFKIGDLVVNFNKAAEISFLTIYFLIINNVDGLSEYLFR